jgi:hypothetical protein
VPVGQRAYSASSPTFPRPSGRSPRLGDGWPVGTEKDNEFGDEDI